jgi:hypothetical protein
LQVREALAPFATRAASQDTAASGVAAAEADLLAANQHKAALAAELVKLGPGAPRTLRDRSRKEALVGELAAVERQLSDLRLWLKANAK